MGTRGHQRVITKKGELDEEFINQMEGAEVDGGAVH